MLTKKIQDALNEQVNKEIYSGYFYLGMSAYAATVGLSGFAGWFNAQWREEIFHARKMMDYIVREKGKVVLKAIEEPPQDFTSPTELFERTLNHERKVTGLIKDLVKLSVSENDKTTTDFLQWFVKEQLEEEATPEGILNKIKAKGEDTKGLGEIDLELAQRK